MFQYSPNHFWKSSGMQIKMISNERKTVIEVKNVCFIYCDCVAFLKIAAVIPVLSIR